MSLQGLLSGASPLLVLAAALFYFLILYIRRDRSTEVHSAGGAHASSGETAVEQGYTGQNRRSTSRTDERTGADLHDDDDRTATPAAVTATAGAVTASHHGAIADYEFTDDTLRRHNRGGYVYGTAATAEAAGAAHSGADDRATAGYGNDGASARALPIDVSREVEGGGGFWRFPLIAAICASLLSCQIASQDGIRGIPGNISAFFNGARPAAPVVVPATVKVEAPAKVVEAPAPAKPEPVKPEPVKAEPVKAEPAKPEPVKPAPVVAEAAPPMTPPGVTQYYGFNDGTAVAAWNAEAKMNPDYVVAAAEPAAPAKAEEPAAAPAPAPAPEPAPVSLGGIGVTSFYGDGQTPDAGKPWSAEATMNPDYVAEAPAPAPAPVAEPAPAPAPAATPAPAPAPEPAPVSLGGIGVTSYYGDGQTPDAGKPWAAPATVYAQPAAAPAPAVVAAVNGCRESLAAAVKAGTINFGTSRWDILPDSYATLDKIARLAKACDGVAIEVAGHTDNTGKATSNKTLSELRAKAVVNYLVGAGVDAGKLKAAGYGQDKPVSDNDSADGRRANRRIEFAVTAK